ncbi:hypothetical protein FRC03_011424 [Tulasnella sp. 419]|nr:hypothetical protein FRC03_011424 [Tulasnella sp. 419]
METKEHNHVLRPLAKKRVDHHMVYIVARNPRNRDERPFSRAYDSIVRECRRHPAWHVKVLVPAQVDALCAAQLLLSLFSKDDVQYTIIPVSGYPNLTQVKDELLAAQEQLHTIILINIGSFLEITNETWFGEFPSRIAIHIIDSARPFDLKNLFGQESTETDPEQGPPRVVVWDDGHADKLVKEREAHERMEYGILEDSDGSEDDSDEEALESTEDDEPSSDGERTPGQRTKKRRRSPSDDGGKRRRRRRTLEGSATIVTRDEQEEYEEILANHFNSGSHHGQSAAGIIYRLCMDKGFADNELLWLAILGLTSQYLGSSITHGQYDNEYQTYEDEVARLNVSMNIPSTGAGDDAGVRPSKEFRLILLQQWTLYDAMLHSGYVANKLGTWKEEGKGRLQRLLAKMGLSIQQYQQAYTYMDLQLRQQLTDQFDKIAGEVGLVDLSYMTFTKSYGYEMARTCAADVVAGIQALLEAAVGVRIYVPTEGGAGGGELFGPRRLWHLKRDGASKGKESSSSKMAEEKRREDGEGEDEEERLLDGEKVWQTNFWIAFDALAYNTNLRQSMTLAKALQEAIVRQGCAILEKKTIKYYREFRLIRIEEGPDLAIFSHPSTLSRLALWLVEATRDRIPTIVANKYASQSKKQKKSLPFVIGCLNERANSYIVVGVTGAPEMGQVRKNHFGLAFLAAKDRAHARTRHGTFETSAVEVNRSDFKAFISALADE